MKKNNIKKIVFIISLLPYIFFLFKGILTLVNEYNKNNFIDIYLIVEPIIDFWFDTIFNFNIFKILLLLFMIIYPIYYIVDKNIKKRNDIKIEEDNQNTKISKVYILYVLSFIPYIIIPISSIFGIDDGMFGNSSMNYGFDAADVVIFTGCIIAVYPIILLFQIIYTLKGKKNFTKKQKNLVKGIILFLLLSTIIPGIIYAIL